ncbi:tetratricopeptide repeat protein [Microbulbifer celer]|uniref:Tetratricopeptide repeat protein n=1 Tax=Microbulbifer celer TaxID=435905 RepID=A0ABW3U5E7_9GAMM|nr:hypothetical protein [Microbulbifer celer]UFN56759.1 hypothetical protein LPW13_14455 [Microbulbifer celer]
MESNVSEELDKLFDEKDWAALDGKIPEEELADFESNAVLFRYKIIAMANIEARRSSDNLIRLTERALTISQEPLFYNILADAHIARENLTAAIDVLNTWKSIEPENPTIFRLFFRCYQQLKDDQQMAHAAISFHFYSGKHLQASLNFEASCEHFYNTYKMAPDFDYATYLYAQSLFLSNEPTTASEVARKIPDNSTFSLKKSEILARSASCLSKFEDGGEHIKAILESDSSNAVALRCRASIAETRNDLVSAIDIYQKILEVYPFDVLANLKIVQLSMMVAKNGSAGIAILDSQKIKLSEILFHAGEGAAGSMLIEGISPKSENYFSARIALAKHYIGSQNFIKALESINATDISSRTHAAMLQLEAECLFQLNHYKDAAQVSRDALESDPENNRCHFLFGASLIKSCERNANSMAEIEDRVRSSLDTYIGATPNDGLPHIYLAQLAYTLGRIDDIPDQIHLARGKGSVSPLGSYLMGQYNLSIGENSIALDEFSDAVDLSGRNIYYDAQIARAELSQKLGSLQAALDDVNEILARWPGNERASALQQLL